MRLSPFLTTPRPYKKAVAIDPQRHILFSLERELLGACIHTHCKREHLEAVIQHACKKFKVEKPKLTIVRKSERVFGRCYDDHLELNAEFHGDNLATMIHELAHWIADRIFEEKIQDHGFEFVCVYAKLLDAYKLIPLDAFKVMAKRWNLKMVY